MSFDEDIEVEYKKQGGEENEKESINFAFGIMFAG